MRKLTRSLERQVFTKLIAVAEETDYVEAANNDVMKGNEKFMKEIKKKYEALAKLRVEASPKKKEEKAPEAKKAEPAEEG